MFDINKRHNPRLGIFISLCLVLILVFFCFYPSLKNGFVKWDDNSYLVENKIVQDLSWQNVKTIFTSSHCFNYHPLALLSYSLEYRLVKLRPGVYHATNLFFHLVNCLLVFWLILILSNNSTVALITALLFGIHPLHVESVAWISERRDVLYSFFFLGSIISYLYYIRNESRKYFSFSVILFVLSVLAKAMALTLPFVLLLIDYLPERKITKNKFKEKVPFFIVAIMFSLVTFAIRSSQKDFTINTVSNIFYNALVACFSLLFYISKMFIPVKLSCLYPYVYGTVEVFNPIFISLFLILFLSVGLIIWFSKNDKRLFFGIPFFLITIFPAINIIPPQSAMSLVSDRYFYLPSVGLFYIIGLLFSLLYTKNKHSFIGLFLILASLISIIVVLSSLTRANCKVWHNDVTLWTNVIKNYPNVATAHNNRGAEFLARKEFGKARLDFINTLRIDPYYYEAYYNLGSLYKEKGDYNKATEFINKTLELKPDYLQAYIMLMDIYIKTEKHPKVIDICKKIIQINPDNPEAYVNLCSAYGTLGNYQEAIKAGEKAITIDPNSIITHANLSLAYYFTKQYDLAIQHFNKAVALGYKFDPDFVRLIAPYRR